MAGSPGPGPGRASPIKVINLTGGKNYHCRVRATNAVGTGSYSGYGTTVVAPAATAPASPTLTSTTPSSTGLSVAFTPNSDGGSPITAFYTQCVSTNGGVTGAKQGSTSPLNVTGLTAGKSYRCRVQARNSVGWSPYSGYGTTVTAPTTEPAAPTVNSTTPSSNGLSVAFTPNSDGGSPITAFHAQCVSTNGGVTSGKQGSTSPLNVTGLTATKSYRCRVQARNTIGWSPYSSYGTTETAP